MKHKLCVNGHDTEVFLVGGLGVSCQEREGTAAFDITLVWTANQRAHTTPEEM